MTEEMSLSQRENFEETAAQVESLLHQNLTQVVTLIMAAHVEGASFSDISIRTVFFYEHGETYSISKVFVKGKAYDIKAKG